MIDNKTSEYLRGIGKQIPQELYDRLQVEDETNDEEEKERIAYIFRTADSKTREKLKYLQDMGAFDKEKTYHIDPAVEKEIDAFWAKKIANAIRDKRIPPCKLDQWARKHLQR